MTIIVTLSLISWAITFTVVFIGLSQKNEDCAMTGVIMILALMLAHAFFQIGAHWQVEDIMEKYQIIKKATQ